MIDTLDLTITPVTTEEGPWQHLPRVHEWPANRTIDSITRESDEDEASLEGDDDDGPSHAHVLALCSALRVVPTRDLLGRALRRNWLAVC